MVRLDCKFPKKSTTERRHHQYGFETVPINESAVTKDVVATHNNRKWWHGAARCGVVPLGVAWCRSVWRHVTRCGVVPLGGADCCSVSTARGGAAQARNRATASIKIMQVCPGRRIQLAGQISRKPAKPRVASMNARSSASISARTCRRSASLSSS